MDAIILSKKQVNALSEIADNLFPENQWVKVDVNGFVAGGRVFYMHWLEFCLVHLLPKVAEIHGKQPYTTPRWSEHMVRQKVINDLPTVNPIDTLYDIWKYPEKYAQTL